MANRIKLNSRTYLDVTESLDEFSPENLSAVVSVTSVGHRKIQKGAVRAS
jgi:hypothetical protein